MIDLIHKHQRCDNYTFELKFHAAPKPWLGRIFYCMDHEEPFSLEFIQFLDESKKKECPHLVDQTENCRHFLKYVPEEVKPFSLKLRYCPECHLPIEYQFIVYLGDVESYPKMKDLKKYVKKGIFGKKKDLPKAKVGKMKKIGS